MRYTGEFNSIEGRTYRIDIVTGTAGSDKKIKLAGTPFVSSVKGDDKTIYAPIRCGGATVGILSENYVFDFYSGQAKGVKVTLLEETASGDIVRWTGYVSPTIYDQGYDAYLEEISIDCVDGVAVLKDLPFRTTEKGILTFGDIIFKCLKESGCFKAFFISDNVQLTADGKDPVIEKLRISASNFFDQRKDMAQTDDDIAWSCYDVLYHLLQWLGYTLTVEGDEVYILDYDAISNGINTYHRYSLEGSSLGTPTYVTKSASKDITGNDYSSNGTRIRLDEVYNKVTVKDEFNTYDSLFPTFGDENLETNLTAGSDPGIINGGPDQLVFGGVVAADPDNSVPESFVFTADTSNLSGYFSANFIKFMDSPVFTFHKYQRSSSRSDITNDAKWKQGNFRYSDLLSTNGAFYLRYSGIKLEPESYLSGLVAFGNLRRNRQTEFDNLNSEAKIDKLAKMLQIVTDPAKISMQSVILLLNSGDFRFGPCDEVNYNDRSGTVDDITKRYPFITLKDQTSSSIFGGKNHFIRIKGKISYHAEPETPHPLDNAYAQYLKRKDDKKFGTQGYIWCKVKWGEQWWNGESESWQKSDCWFKLYYWDPEDTPSSWKNSEHYAKEFNIVSNMKNNGIYFGEEGYIIPCPVDGNLNGTPEVAFTTRDMEGDSRRSHWSPKGTKMDNFSCRYFSECVFITDLSITAEVSPGLLSDADLNSDTCYTNVIDNGSLAAMNDVTFKVCTDDGKKPSYSSVDIMQGSDSSFVKTTYNKALRIKERGTEGCDGLDGVLRQEEHMVFKLASHYEKPRVRFECNLHNEDFPMYTAFTDVSLGERKFIISEKETDYRFNKVALTITEKE